MSKRHPLLLASYGAFWSQRLAAADLFGSLPRSHNLIQFVRYAESRRLFCMLCASLVALLALEGTRINESILQHFREDLPFQVRTDRDDTDLGAVLLQLDGAAKCVPAYVGRRFSVQEANWYSSEIDWLLPGRFISYLFERHYDGHRQ